MTMLGNALGNLLGVSIGVANSTGGVAQQNTLTYNNQAGLQNAAVNQLTVGGSGAGGAWGGVVPNNAVIGAHANVVSGPPLEPTKYLTSKDLEREVFNTPIDTLVDLWVAKYGNEWVSVDEVLKDEFYAMAFTRLRSMNLLESHYLTDRSRYVCRRPE